MAAKCSITGSVVLGGGFMVHTEYKVQVNKDGDSWVVYRRYKDFEVLFKQLLQTFGEERLARDSVTLPDKQFGSQLSTLKSIVSERESLLQRFLDGIQQFDDYTQHGVYGQFLDCKNKGLSGVQIQMGKNKVLKEAFANTRYIKNFVGIWKMRYVAILKSGTIIVLRSMYDASSNAVVSLSLTSGDVTVTPKASDNIILFTVKSTNHSLAISFTTPSEAAFWIRTVSDFALTSRTDQLKGRTEAVEAANTPQGKSSGASPLAQAPQQVEEIHADGTGNTTDELSELMGI